MAAGYVLTGGASRRMGRDKALLPYRGRTLVEAIADEVRHATSSVTLVGAPERYRHLGLPVLSEDFPGCGPLSGVEAALRHSPAPWNLIAGCDMAGVRSEWLNELLTAAAAHPEATIVVPESPDGQLHALCAAWHVRALEPVRAALSSHKYKLTDTLFEIGFVSHRAEWSANLRNVNTPEEWEAIVAP